MLPPSRKITLSATFRAKAISCVTMIMVMSRLPIRGAVGDADEANRWLGIIDGAFFAIVLPLVMGAVLGFMLLDEKDNHTLTAIRATPVSVGAYLAWRTTAVGLFTIVVVTVTHPIAGLSSSGGQ